MSASELAARKTEILAFKNESTVCELLMQGVSEVRSTRFPLIKIGLIYPPGQSRPRATRARCFFFMSIFRGSAAYLVLSARNGVLAREIEPSG